LYHLIVTQQFPLAFSLLVITSAFDALDGQ
jgi:hypothetical protein